MDRKEAGEIVRNLGWLSRQPEAFRDALLRRCHLERFAKGETLYRAGEAPGGLYGLVQGVLDVELPNGMLGTVRAPGYWVGETAAFRRAPRLASIIAKSEVHVLRLPLAEFERLIANAEYCRCFALLAIEHLDEALELSLALMMRDPLGRVCVRLHALARRQPGGVSAFALTQARLGEMCGLTRQTVNAVLKRLAAEGVVAVDYGRLAIRDAARLEALARPRNGEA